MARIFFYAVSSSWRCFHNYITMYLSRLVLKIKDIFPHGRQRCIVAEFSSTAKTYFKSEYVIAPKKGRLTTALARHEHWTKH